MGVVGHVITPTQLQYRFILLIFNEGFTISKKEDKEEDPIHSGKFEDITDYDYA